LKKCGLTDKTREKQFYHETPYTKLEADMNIAKIAGKIQGEILQFSGKVSRGILKVSRRFIEEMVYGIQTRGSVKLSEVARSLHEGISLRKTINRLSQQLKRPGLMEHIEEAIIYEGERRIKEDALLIVAISDSAKPYAEMYRKLFL